MINVLFDDRVSGPSRRVIEVGRRLKHYRVETTVCLPAGCGEVSTLSARAGLRVRRVAFRRIPRPSDLGAVIRWIAAMHGDLNRFRQAFLDEGADLVHVNGAFFVVPAIAAKQCGIPLVWHLNDTIVSPRISWIFGQFVRFLADRVIVAAGAVADHYGVARSSPEVVYAPVDGQRFVPVARSPLYSREGRIRVGCIANWYPAKGIEYFVRACALLREKLGNVTLDAILVGARLATQAAYCQKVDALIRDLGLRSVIRERGFVDDVHEELKKLDILVLSSTSEACPIVVLEAMSSGVPVVATDVGGVRELIAPGSIDCAGLVVTPRSPEAIAQGVLAIAESAELAAQMGLNGQRRARARFSVESCTEKHVKVYCGVARRPGWQQEPESGNYLVEGLNLQGRSGNLGSEDSERDLGSHGDVGAAGL